MLIEESPNFTQELKQNILENMAPDELSEIVRKDIILKFGKSLFDQLPHAHLNSYIRQRMRQTARLFQCVNAFNAKINSMDDLLSLANY